MLSMPLVRRYREERLPVFSAHPFTTYLGTEISAGIHPPRQINSYLQISFDSEISGLVLVCKMECLPSATHQVCSCHLGSEACLHRALDSQGLKSAPILNHGLHVTFPTHSIKLNDRLSWKATRRVAIGNQSLSFGGTRLTRNPSSISVVLGIKSMALQTPGKHSTCEPQALPVYFESMSHKVVQTSLECIM